MPSAGIKGHRTVKPSWLGNRGEVVQLYVTIDDGVRMVEASTDIVLTPGLVLVPGTAGKYLNFDTSAGGAQNTAEQAVVLLEEVDLADGDADAPVATSGLFDRSQLVHFATADRTAFRWEDAPFDTY